MCDWIHELLEVFGSGDAATDVLQRTGVERLPGIGFVLGKEGNHSETEQYQLI